MGWDGGGRQEDASLKYFKEGQWPASTYLVVAALAVPQMLIEVEAVAMFG
jgi:enamine deaminase RidA (YjgF/YER057c/UK114 family)